MSLELAMATEGQMLSREELSSSVICLSLYLYKHYVSIYYLSVSCICLSIFLYLSVCLSVCLELSNTVTHTYLLQGEGQLI